MSLKDRIKRQVLALDAGVRPWGYDVLVLAALGLQALFLATKLERWDEALVILIFHAVGTAMEDERIECGAPPPP